MGGVPVDRLAAEHGTPLFIVEEAHVRERLRRFRAAFGAEAILVLCVGPDSIDPASSFTGTRKIGSRARYAVRAGIARVVVDHPGELDRLARFVRTRAAGAFEPVRVLLRLNIDVRPETHASDVIAETARLPIATEVGDLVAIPATGAYVSAMSSRYNGLGRPPVVFVGESGAREVVRRETPDDLLSCDRQLDESPAAGPDIPHAPAGVGG